MPADRRPADGAGTRRLAAFGRFWKDFFVGDAPELFVGALIAVAGGAVVVHAVSARILTIAVVPVLVVAVLVASVRRARPRPTAAPSPPTPGDGR